MKTSRMASIRSALSFWIVFPLLVSIFLIALVEIGVRFFWDETSAHAYGIAFLASIIPVICAHLIFFAAISGLASCLFGEPPTKKFFVVSLLGLACGGFVFHGIYLK